MLPLVTSNRLKRALEHLENDKIEPALALVIEEWQKTRDPRTAEVVDEIDRALALPPLSKEASKQWNQVARDPELSIGARGPVIRAIHAMTTHDILGALAVTDRMKWDDPRVGSMAIALLRELRFSGNRSKPFWRPFFEHLPKLRDPRFALLAETLPTTWSVGPSMQKWLANQLAEAASFRLSSQPPDETLMGLLSLAKSKTAAKERSGVGEHAGGISGDTLLADIYANPEDDAARFVYADWLLERGDPRGEFITLQLTRSSDKDKAALKRERELLKAHKKEWLGRLVNVTGGDLIFRRGFLAEATVKFRHQRDVEQYGSLPEWATLEKLEWGDHLVRDDQIEWSRFIGPTMRHVKVAKGPMGKFLLKDGPPWAVEDLELWRGDNKPEIYQALLASKRLEKLRVLGVYYAQPTWLEAMTACPTELRLYASLDGETFEDWRRVARPVRPLSTLTFRSWGGADYRFTRDDRGEFTRLAVELRPRSKTKSIHPTPPEVSTALATLRSLGAGVITSFEATIEIDGTMVDASPLMESIQRLIRRS